ncbi:hypothetical protein LPJ66_008300 [Kickxella alabastrina]|uniref:Uncharacterized protein n=1 Tax=Kickxella alabastrina TaxID=61397 RepID=A0ACC1I8Y5_9FUNG|nr:hypothetical protein LPJ66_008300 [Kickxella alabastrina]
MGIFWPLDNFSQATRLAALVGIAAGCCALADRDTRYVMLRYLYNQLKSLDEASAFDIESATKDKPPSIHLRDTRSYASDSTAISRASSPATARGGRMQNDYDSTPISPPSSALCNTPEDLAQLGEALNRWKITQSAVPHRSSPLSGTPSVVPSQGLYYNVEVQSGVVNMATNEVLMPLVTVPGPLTPTSEATPTPDVPMPKPIEELKQEHSDEPKAKVIDASKRLSPLPNPSAPKSMPIMRDGRPQPFDYPPPLSITPKSVAARPSGAQKPIVARRDRGHVQIETTDHESYGFVSNPAAFVPPSIGQGIAPEASASSNGDHYLFVCVKCHRQSTNEVCEKICSDEDGVLRCKLRPRDGQQVDDMEDLVMPQTPNIYTDGRRKTTGRMLYENLQALHTQHERLKERAACRGAEPHSHGPASRECPNAVKSRLRIVPVSCLSMCHLGNVIAVSGPGKFGYQFGAMRENDSEDMQAILQFAEDYIESSEGFTKNKTRPARLSRNILARIPPPLPTFTSIYE